jgi:DEAD/DEAH box helicase domain-containing protein
MSVVFGVDNVHIVEEDGSPCGRKVRSLIHLNAELSTSTQEYVVWNPPLIAPRAVTQGRVSTVNEPSKIFRFLMDRGIRCIVFCKVRKICELVIKQVRTDLALEGRDDMSQRVMSYRSGYSAQVRCSQ